MELIECLDSIQKAGLLKTITEEKNHLYSQWQIVLDNPSVSYCGVFRKLIKRMQLAPNSQAGCERSNSKYARYKNKYSSRMGLEIIRARARAGENGPPLPQFPASKARQFWEDNNHRLALKIDGSSDSLVLKRRRKISQKKYTSRNFIDLN